MVLVSVSHTSVTRNMAEGQREEIQENHYAVGAKAYPASVLALVCSLGEAAQQRNVNDGRQEDADVSWQAITRCTE